MSVFSIYVHEENVLDYKIYMKLLSDEASSSEMKLLKAIINRQLIYYRFLHITIA